MESERLTVICTTISRPQCARDFVLSLRAVMPGVRIILSEQSDAPELVEFCRDNAVHHIALPFDAGLSVARNTMLRHVETDYFALTDEDFRFDAAPDFGYCERFLNAHQNFIGVTGSLDDRRAKPNRGRVAHNFAFDDIGGGLIVLPLAFVVSEQIAFEGETVTACNFGPNWGLFRTSSFKDEGLYWDEEFKIGGEHEDFYLRLKVDHPTLRASYWPGLRCAHVDSNEEAYVDLRRRKEWLDIFRRKWSFKYRFDLGGLLRTYDNYFETVPVITPQVERLQDLYRGARHEVAMLKRQSESLAIREALREKRNVGFEPMRGD